MSASRIWRIMVCPLQMDKNARLGPENNVPAELFGCQAIYNLTFRGCMKWVCVLCRLKVKVEDIIFLRRLPRDAVPPTNIVKYQFGFAVVKRRFRIGCDEYKLRA